MLGTSFQIVVFDIAELYTILNIYAFHLTSIDV